MTSYQHSLTPTTREKIQTAIRRSLAPATLRSYQSAIRLYLGFCEREGIPPRRRTPASKLLLCAFAADGIDQVSGSTTRNRLAALKAWHSANNWPWSGSERLSRILSGIQNSSPLSSKRPKRPPVTIYALELLTRHLNLQDSCDVAVLACASTAFWGQCRLGELLPVSGKSFILTSLPSRKSIRYSPGNHDTWVLNLPSTKTSRRGQDVPLIRQTGPTNPLRVLHNHLQMNKNPPHMPLFTFLSRGERVILTKKLFLDRCNDIWSRFNLPRLTGHSFRIGGTTHLLLSGIPPDVVKTMGRWSSDAFLRYWRMSEYIAPLYAKNIPTLQYRPSIKHSSPSLGVSSSHRGMRRLAGSSRLLG